MFSDTTTCATDPFHLGAFNNPAFAGTCLNGTLWRSASTLVGFSVPGVLGAFTGLHPSDVPIADHYFDIEPDRTKAFRILGRPLQLALPRRFRDPGPLAILWPFLGVPRDFSRRFLPATEIVVRDFEAGLAAVQDDGAGVLLGSSPVAGRPAAVSRLFESVFQSGLVWASAVEPNVRVGGSLGSVLALALSADGTAQKNAAIVTENGVLVSVTETESSVTIDSGVGTAPSPRHDFSAVYSRAVRGVYVIGGTARATETPVGDVWFRPVGGSWTELHYAGYTPAVVLAATYSFADQGLWVLDQFTDSDHEPRLRLSLLDPHGGFASQLATWRPSEGFHRWFFSIDRDGSILLTRATERRYVTVRLRTERTSLPRAHITSIFGQEGTLLMAPVVDDNNYAFLTRHPESGIRLRREPTLASRDTDEGSEVTLLGDELQELF